MLKSRKKNILTGIKFLKSRFRFWSQPGSDAGVSLLQLGAEISCIAPRIDACFPLLKMVQVFKSIE